MKKAYIAGAGGMLGDAFYRVFKDKWSLKCSDKDLNEDWLSYLDFRDRLAYEDDVRSFSPDVLIHLGAHTDLEYCEKFIDDAYITNTLSVEYAVSIANSLDIPLLYISTAGIFDGVMPAGRDFYDDWDNPNPLGVYARSKYMGEKLVLQQAKQPLVCRAGWMMGGGRKKDKKFISKIIRQIESGTKHLNIVSDKDGTPTFTDDFAKNCELLLNEKQVGVHNLVCGGMTSRVDVTNEILSFFQINGITITPVESDFFKNEYFAPRPPNERLLNYKLNLKKLNIMRDWKTCLHEYLGRDYYDIKIK